MEPGLEDLVRAYQSMSGTHESNTMAMLARDGASRQVGQLARQAWSATPG